VKYNTPTLVINKRVQDYLYQVRYQVLFNVPLKCPWLFSFLTLVITLTLYTL